MQQHPSMSITLSLQLLPQPAQHTVTFIPRLLYLSVMSLILPLLSLASGWTSKLFHLLHLTLSILLLNLQFFSSTLCLITEEKCKWWQVWRLIFGYRWSLGLGKRFMKWVWMIWSLHLEVGRQHPVRLLSQLLGAHEVVVFPGWMLHAWLFHSIWC